MKDPFGAPKYVRAGQVLGQMLEAIECPALALPDLDWDKDLFARAKTDALKAAEPKRFAPKKEDDGTRCYCGCGQPHKNNATRVVEVPTTFGTKSREVLWYVSRAHADAHRAKGG